MTPRAVTNTTPQQIPGPNGPDGGEPRQHTFSFGTIAYDTTEPVNLATVEMEVRATPKGPELSICGNIWNRRKTDILSGGQNLNTMAEYLSKSPRFMRLYALSQRWHLNGMKAGCEHQRAEGWDTRPIDPAKPTNTYGTHFDGQRSASWNLLGWVRRDEHPAGLMCEPCHTCGYKYGTAWLHEPLPPEVLAEIDALIAEDAK